MTKLCKPYCRLSLLGCGLFPAVSIDLALAVRTVKTAAAGLHQALHRRGASWTWLSDTSIDRKTLNKIANIPAWLYMVTQ